MRAVSRSWWERVRLNRALCGLAAATLELILPLKHLDSACAVAGGRDWVPIPAQMPAFIRAWLGPVGRGDGAVLSWPSPHKSPVHAADISPCLTRRLPAAR